MALNDYEVSLNSTLVLGAATQVLVHGIDGLGSSAKTSDTERDGASGGWQGTDWLEKRELTINATIISGALTAQAMLLLLQSSWNSVGVSGDQELGIKFPGIPELVTVGRARGMTYDSAKIGRAAIPIKLQFSDRRGYLATKAVASATGSLTSTGSGAPWPWTWPVSFGAGSSRTMTCYNGGAMASRPFIRIDGGCTNPRVTQPSTGDFVGISGTIAAGDYVEINVENVTVKNKAGASVMTRLVPGSSWLTIPKGTSTLVYSASGDVGSSANVYWRSPYAL